MVLKMLMLIACYMILWIYKSLRIFNMSGLFRLWEVWENIAISSSRFHFQLDKKIFVLVAQPNFTLNLTRTRKRLQYLYNMYICDSTVTECLTCNTQTKLLDLESLKFAKGLKGHFWNSYRNGRDRFFVQYFKKMPKIRHI